MSRGATGKFSAALLVLLGLGLMAAGCGPKSEEPQTGTAQPPSMTRLGPGGGGSTFIPTFHPRDPNRILLRCDMGGAYFSPDGGNSWEMFNFLGGARAFAFDPSDPETMYVGGAGLNVTHDGGASWQQIFPAPESVTQISYEGDHASPSFVTTDNFPQGPGNSVSAILVDSQDSSHLLAGVNGRSDGQRLAGLYSSRDGGGEWNLVAKLDGPVLRMLELPGDRRQVVVLWRRGRLLLDESRDVMVEEVGQVSEGLSSVTSVDGGLNPSSGRFQLWAVGRQERGAIGEGGDLFQSPDLGKTWQKVELTVNGLSGGDARASISGIACSSSDARIAYATCDRWMTEDSSGSAGHWYGVLKTADAGASWNWVYQAGGGHSDYTVRDGVRAANVHDSWVREAFGGEYIRMLDVAVDPGNPQTAIFTDWYRALKTTDGGLNWNALYSETLETGAVRSRGLDVTTCYGVHFDPFNSDHIAVSYTDIGYFHSFDRGRTWQRSVQGVPPAWDNTCYWMQFDPAVQGMIWSAWSSWHDIPRLKMIRQPDWKELAVGGVCLSEDGGKSWVVTSDGLPANSPVTSLVLDPDSPEQSRTLYAAIYGQGVYKTEDGGAHWTQKNQGVGPNLNAWELTRGSGGSLYLIVAHNTQFDGKQVMPDLQPGEIYRSTDGAERWEKLALPPGVRYPNSLAVDSGNPRQLYLACWGRITRGDYGADGPEGSMAEVAGGAWRSDDGGATWQSVFDPQAYVYGISLDSRIPGRVYLNTFQGAAYFSNDSGQSWNRLEGYNFGWGHRVIPDPEDPAMVYLTTFGGSVYHGPVERAQ